MFTGLTYENQWDFHAKIKCQFWPVPAYIRAEE